jgi:hypothetical protein
LGAEGVGFEPTEVVTPQRFSRPPHDLPIVGRHLDLRLDPSVVAPHLPHDNHSLPPDLAAVVAAWPELPEALRAGIVAMVRAALT